MPAVSRTLVPRKIKDLKPKRQLPRNGGTNNDRNNEWTIDGAKKSGTASSGADSRGLAASNESFGTRSRFSRVKVLDEPISEEGCSDNGSENEANRVKSSSILIQLWEKFKATPTRKKIKRFIASMVLFTALKSIYFADLDDYQYSKKVLYSTYTNSQHSPSAKKMGGGSSSLRGDGDGVKSLSELLGDDYLGEKSDGDKSSSNTMNVRDELGMNSKNTGKSTSDSFGSASQSNFGSPNNSDGVDMQTSFNSFGKSMSDSFGSASQSNFSFSNNSNGSNNGGSMQHDSFGKSMSDSFGSASGSNFGFSNNNNGSNNGGSMQHDSFGKSMSDSFGSASGSNFGFPNNNNGSNNGGSMQHNSFGKSMSDSFGSASGSNFGFPNNNNGSNNGGSMQHNSFGKSMSDSFGSASGSNFGFPNNNNGSNNGGSMQHNSFGKSMSDSFGSASGSNFGFPNNNNGSNNGGSMQHNSFGKSMSDSFGSASGSNFGFPNNNNGSNNGGSMQHNSFGKSMSDSFGSASGSNFGFPNNNNGSNSGGSMQHNSFGKSMSDSFGSASGSNFGFPNNNNGSNNGGGIQQEFGHRSFDSETNHNDIQSASFNSFTSGLDSHSDQYQQKQKSQLHLSNQGSTGQSFQGLRSQSQNTASSSAISNEIRTGHQCASHGGPYSAEEFSEMIYWRDIPSDALFTSPYYDPQIQESQPKYLTFEMDGSGWNNIRLGFENMMLLAHSMGRTLVLPPKRQIAHGMPDMNGRKIISFDDFYDIERIKTRQDGLDIISFEEFLIREAVNGNLKSMTSGEVIYPPNNQVNWHNQRLEPLWSYITTISRTFSWHPKKCVLAFPARDTDDQHLFSMMADVLIEKDGRPFPEYNEFQGKPVNVDAPTIERFRESLAGRRKICMYDSDMHKNDVVHFKAEENEERLILPYYAFMFWEDWQQMSWAMRFVRDNLVYNDEIFCLAARLVNAIRDYVRQHSPENTEGLFDAIHIRRDDFQSQFPLTEMSVTDILEGIKDEISPGSTLYIATDERDPSFFEPLREVYDLKFLGDFGDMLKGVNPQYFGLAEQLICSRSRVFFGTYFSSFSAYINRLRGYYSVKENQQGFMLGSLQNTYYLPAQYKKEMSIYQAVHVPFYAREFPIAWRDIDKHLLT